MLVVSLIEIWDFKDGVEPVGNVVDQYLERLNTIGPSTVECELAEDLFRAVKTRDAEALDEARSPSGSNRAALANLHSSMRTLVQEIRLSGVARKQVKDTTSSKKKKPSSNSLKYIARTIGYPLLIYCLVLPRALSSRTLDFGSS